MPSLQHSSTRTGGLSLHPHDAYEPRTRRLREYTLYTTGPDGRIFAGSREYYSGVWIARVRASSVRHAYSLLARQTGATGHGVGIVRLDNSGGPAGAGWPWRLPMKMYGPNWLASSLPPNGWPANTDEIRALERTAQRNVTRKHPRFAGLISTADLDEFGSLVDLELRRLADVR